MKTKFNYEDIKGDLEKNLLLMLKDEKTSFSKGTFNMKKLHFPSDKSKWTRVGNNTYQILIADTLFQLKYKNNDPSTNDLWIGSKTIDKLNSKELNSKPNDVNYTKLKKIIENNGNTDFAIDVINSILESKVRGQIILKEKQHTMYVKTEETVYNYILSKPFKYKYNYKKGVSFFANFYVLIFEGEISLIRVGRDKTQVGFYDITNSRFFKESYEKREAHKIFDSYLETKVKDERDILINRNINNANYKFYENKTNKTINCFWLFISNTSKFIKELAKGLDTTPNLNFDGTGTVTDFGEIYLRKGFILKKDNAFVLGEIYGHGANIDKKGSAIPDPIAGGELRTRFWIADVENPNTASQSAAQFCQTIGWEYYKNIRIKTINTNGIISSVIE